MTTEVESKPDDTDAVRPSFIDALEYLLHHACFLWWRLTNQLPKNMSTPDG